MLSRKRMLLMVVVLCVLSVLGNLPKREKCLKNVIEEISKIHDSAKESESKVLPGVLPEKINESLRCITEKDDEGNGEAMIHDEKINNGEEINDDEGNGAEITHDEKTNDDESNNDDQEDKETTKDKELSEMQIQINDDKINDHKEKTETTNDMKLTEKQIKEIKEFLKAYEKEKFNGEQWQSEDSAKAKKYYEDLEELSLKILPFGMKKALVWSLVYLGKAKKVIMRTVEFIVDVVKECAGVVMKFFKNLTAKICSLPDKATRALYSLKNKIWNTENKKKDEDHTFDTDEDFYCYFFLVDEDVMKLVGDDLSKLEPKYTVLEAVNSFTELVEIREREIQQRLENLEKIIKNSVQKVLKDCPIYQKAKPTEEAHEMNSNFLTAYVLHFYLEFRTTHKLTDAVSKTGEYELQVQKRIGEGEDYTIMQILKKANLDYDQMVENYNQMKEQEKIAAIKTPEQLQKLLEINDEEFNKINKEEIEQLLSFMRTQNDAKRKEEERESILEMTEKIHKYETR